MDGASVKNLRMFRKLCGSANLGNVILATTMWEKVPLAEGNERERQLKDEFWKDMLAKGSTIARVSTDRAQATELVKKFLKNSPIVTRLQKELSAGKTLDQTEAGAAVQQYIEKLTIQYKKDLEDAKKEIKAAQRKRMVSFCVVA
jgi:hypothetical protein